MKTLHPLYWIVVFTLTVGLACSAANVLTGSRSTGAGSTAGNSTDNGSTTGNGSTTDNGSTASSGLNFGGQGTGPGLFTDVRGLGVNPATGAIFTADYHDGRVQAFDPTGKFIKQWLVGSKNAIITGMTADSKGNVFIVTGGKILRYDPTGKLIATLAVPDVFINHAVVGADGNLLASADEETILRLSPDGKVLSTIEKAFTANGGDTELDVLVAEDAAGDIYALGTFNNAVFKFSPDGKFVSRFGSNGMSAGKFTAPECIAVDNKGRVYVGDFQGIQVFDGSGAYQSLISVQGAARYIVFDAKDNLYFTTSRNMVVKTALPNP